MVCLLTRLPENKGDCTSLIYVRVLGVATIPGFLKIRPYGGGGKMYFSTLGRPPLALIAFNAKVFSFKQRNVCERLSLHFFSKSVGFN